MVLRLVSRAFVAAGIVLVLVSMTGIASTFQSRGATWLLTTVDDGWRSLHRASLDGMREILQTGGAAWLWDPVLTTMLRLPASAVAALVAGIMLGRIARLGKAGIAPGTASTAATNRAPADGKPELAAALARVRSAFAGIFVFSGMINVLMLTGSFYMLEIYDRVLPSGSIPTLVAITILATLLFLAQGVLDMIRARVMVRIGASIDESLSERVYETIVRLPLRQGQQADGMQPLRDLDSIRGFLSGQGPIAMFDLPWAPIYMAIIFGFHFTLGMTALVGAIVLISLALVAGVLTRNPVSRTTQHAAQRIGIAEASRRNAEVLRALGMTGRMGQRWSEANQSFLAANQTASDVAGGFGALTKGLRMMLQSAMLAVGAYLVIGGEASGGIIIAGSILSSRALSPVDQAIASWRSYVGARQSWTRLDKLLTQLPPDGEPLALPPPSKTLSVENLSVAPPGEQRLIVRDAEFALQAGSALGVVGPSGSGKTSLARAIVGVWPGVRGHVRLDGATLAQWNPDALGRHIGYLPQDVELFEGTIAENIARFGEIDSDKVIEAARQAGMHDMILRFPKGYDTPIGSGGSFLSGGQRQRIALARALYGGPSFIVLDEPNSNLDDVGETALVQAVLAQKAAGRTLVVITHRTSILSAVDKLLLLRDGTVQAFGPRQQVLEALARASQGAPGAAQPAIAAVPAQRV